METPRTLIRALATNSPATPDGVPLETVEDNDLIFPACSKMTVPLCHRESRALGGGEGQAERQSV